MKEFNRIDYYIPFLNFFSKSFLNNCFSFDIPMLDVAMLLLVLSLVYTTKIPISNSRILHLWKLVLVYEFKLFQKTVNYFRKKFHLRCLTGFKHASELRYLKKENYTKAAGRFETCCLGFVISYGFVIVGLFFFRNLQLFQPFLHQWDIPQKMECM